MAILATKMERYLNMKINLEIVFNLINKIFRKRRQDVSLSVFAKFIFLLIYYKINKEIKRLPSKKGSCLILFPPSLGLGDLIILSRIIDIIRDSKKYKYINIGHAAPYLQIIDPSIKLINLNNIKELIRFEEFILPSPSFLNNIISLILGKKNCKGYIGSNNKTNLQIEKNYLYSFNDPYYYRLKPFKDFFKYKKGIKPIVWTKKNHDNLKLKKSYFSINKLSKKTENFLVISTYNFYSKFRPSLLSIFSEIKKYQEKNKLENIIILGYKSKKEIRYNTNLEKNLKEKFKKTKIYNLSGKLTIQNSLELISQSSYYIGANNGLANVAQMLGVNCTLIFQGPEKFSKRKFSQFAKSITY